MRRLVFPSDDDEYELKRLCAREEASISDEYVYLAGPG